MFTTAQVTSAYLRFDPESRITQDTAAISRIGSILGQTQVLADVGEVTAPYELVSVYAVALLRHLPRRDHALPVTTLLVANYLLSQSLQTHDFDTLQAVLARVEPEGLHYDELAGLINPNYPQ